MGVANTSQSHSQSPSGRHFITDVKDGLLGAICIYSRFRVSSPVCPLHTAVTHVSKVLEPLELTWIPMAISMWDSAVPVL